MRAAFVLSLSLCCACAEPPRVDIPVTSLKAMCRDGSGICVPADQLTRMLGDEDFEILAWRGTAHGISGALTFWLSFPVEHVVLRAKWKQATHGGSGLDNEPRKELAAYRLQQLFLDEKEYVVPPTVTRCLPSHFYHQKVRRAKPTFDHTRCVFGALAYWLEGVHELSSIDSKRFENDLVYRAAIANLNLVTYLFDHRDTRASNFVITNDHDAPRAFSIDNGMALSGVMNPRTALRHEWQHIRVPKLPHTKLERLRAIKREDLDVLATVAEYHIVDRQLVPVPPTAPLDPDAGVRRRDDVVQLGLTRSEIDGIYSRIQSLLARVDAHQLEEY